MIFLKTDNRRQVQRYLIIRIASRGGDIVIYMSILYIYGLDSLPYAFTISALYDYTLDFFGQKLWTFGNRFEFSWGIAKEFGVYLLVRGGILVLAGICYYIMTTHLGLKMVAALAVTFVIFLPVAFIYYRKIFLRKMRDH